MKFKIIGSFVGVVIICLIAYKFLNFQDSSSSSDPVTVKWDLLYKLDYKQGKAPPELKKLDGKLIKIAGYVVPLSDDFSNLKEFLFVPDAQSCVHVPPPPPNLIIQSKLKKSLSSRDAPNPAWVTGVLRIESTKSKYGVAGFQMEVEKLEKFVYEGD